MMVTYHNAILRLANNLLKDSRDYTSDPELIAYADGAIDMISFTYGVTPKRIHMDMRNAIDILNEDAEY